MAFPLRWLLIGVTWLFVAGFYCLRPSLPSSGCFEPDANALPTRSSAAVFKKSIVNPGQGLPMVHVASLATMAGGIEAAVWYGGSAECAPDVKIYFSENENGAVWSAPRVIMDRQKAELDLGRPMKSVGNAILLSESDGTLRLLFVTIAMGRWSGSQLNTSFSKDGGITWSRAERLTLSPFFNFSELVRNRAIPLIGGGWCVPIYQEFLGKFPELLWLKEQQGELLYRKTRIAGGCSTFQPSLIPLNANRALVLLRDYTDKRKIFISRSDDGGKIWRKPVPTQLPNPDSGISGLKLSDGRLLLAYNDSPDGRDNLALGVSDDQGATWQKLVTLEKESGSTFSYPFLSRSPDGSIDLAYTRKGKEIALTSFNEAWIAEACASLSKIKGEAKQP
jgi:hypothetical protein